MASDFISKIKKIFRKNSKKSNSFNHGYSSGEIDRTYIDPERNFSYDFVALAVRKLVVKMRLDLTRYYEGFPQFSAEKAKKMADNYIANRVDPIAKEAEKDEVSARVFCKMVKAMYKDLGLELQLSELFNFYYYPEPDVVDTKL